LNNASNWASLEMKKNPWWRDDMSPEEYDAEREYYVKNFDNLVVNGLYKPLWQQKN
jgi:hypothetical protein